MMMPRYGIALAAFLAALASACGAAQREVRPLASPASIQVPAEPGPERWAAEARVRCGRLEREPRLACYEAAVLETLREHGVASAMETVNRLAAADADAWHQGHVLAHVVGLAAYRSPDEVGAVFAECTPAFQSGCYHGVIQAYFDDLRAADRGPLDAGELNALCADYRADGGDRWLLFQCAHGMGHGLVAVHAYHLPGALGGCDLLEDGWERESCYGGAFMESLVNATMPHHAPGPAGDHGAAGPATAADEHEHGQSHRGHGDHGSARVAGHEHHRQSPAASAFRALDPEDPHYPCNALDARYVNACYAMQTSAVLFWSEGDVAAGVAFCEEAPEQVRSTCFTSLGRDINAYTRQDHAQAIDACLQAPQRFQPACVVGVAKNLIDVTADPADGIAFCRAVARGSNRERCFQAVGEQVAVLENDGDRRAQQCAALEPGDRPACRFGAGVRDAPPSR